MAAELFPSTRAGLLRLLYEEDRVVVEDRIVAAAALELKTQEALREAWRCLARLEVPLFPLRGRDILAEGGIEAGPQIGVLLGEIEAWWIARDFAPDREACLEEMRLLLRRRLADARGCSAPSVPSFSPQRREYDEGGSGRD